MSKNERLMLEEITYNGKNETERGWAILKGSKNFLSKDNKIIKNTEYDKKDIQKEKLPEKNNAIIFENKTIARKIIKKYNNKLNKKKNNL